MTKEEVLALFENKLIPLSFEKDCIKYRMRLWLETIYTDSFDFPLLYEGSYGNPMICFKPKLFGNNYYSFINPDFKTVLTDFLYWFELHKHQFTNITYYDKTTN